LLPKRLEVLRELLPTITSVGVLVNPNNPNTEPGIRQLRTLAATTGGWSVHVANVTAASDLESAFASLVEAGAGAFLYITDAIFPNERDQILTLANHYKLPGVYATREYVEAGGLMSYGSNDQNIYRQAGIYAGRILNGTKVGDLPVQQESHIELFINMKAA